VPNLKVERAKRCFAVSQPDQRDPFARDRDRILYSSAFHRLAGITQIVKAGELDIFHTRQQHTYKVAQVGRRLAEYCKSQAADLGVELLVEPEVVEAACLAHDLGHPPFGHAAEAELDHLVRGLHRKEPDPAIFDDDGFEGNAQTFRILTKLAVRYDVEQCHGLDLTRATLQAVLKYPWLRNHDDEKKRSKWSAYKSEERYFSWAVEHAAPDQKSDEAELMDWADDIAYSVHDLEDFHRVGIIPWHIILSDGERDRLVAGAVSKWFGAPADANARMRGALDRIEETVFPFPAVTDEIYDGTREQRNQLRNLTSIWIGRFIQSVGIDVAGDSAQIQLETEASDDVRMLKYFARHYIIGLPALSAQQFGQRRVIRDLFEIFLERGLRGKLDLMPSRLRYIWEDHRYDKPARLAADCISSLTENEAQQLHRRLTGIETGSVLDPIVR
jgi:dGTPase